jgi:NADP-dependent 3-hydroxy acid dehydrogenase YdfG
VRLGKDTRALVTGASRGIGRAVAEELLRRGATVGLASRSPEPLAGNSIPLAADVGERAEIEGAVARFVAEAGGLDVLVANAGVAYYGPFRDAPVEEAEEMTRVNWLGTVYAVHAALPHMLDRASGHIAIVSSVAAHRTFPWAAVYGATKAAQRGFAEALRHELSGTGVELTAVYPGEVETHLHDHARAHGRMPDWRRQDGAIPPAQAAHAILAGIEQRRAAVYVPANTRLLGILHGLSPALADRLLRAVLGGTAAPAGRSR